MRFDGFYTTGYVAISLRQVVSAKVLDEVFGTLIKIGRKLKFLVENFVEDFVRRPTHERRSTINQFIDHDAKSIPIYRM